VSYTCREEGQTERYAVIRYIRRAKKYYTVVSKIRTLTYRKLPILPIKLGKVCQGLEAEPFEFQIMVFRPWFLVLCQGSNDGLSFPRKRESRLRAYPNNRVVMRPSEKFEAKAAGQKGSEAWFSPR